MLSFMNISDYELEIDIKSKKIIIIFVIIFSFLSLFLQYVKLDKYYVLNCMVLEDLLVCPCEYSNVSKVTAKNSFVLDNKKYYYDIYSISEEVERKNNIYYKQIFLQTDLGKKNIDYNVLQIKIILYRENLFFYIKKMIGGDNYERSK